MELFDLPPKTVVQDGILPYLKWNDLLILRQVSHKGKAIVQDYVQQHPELAPEIEIHLSSNKTCYNLDAFLVLGLLSTKIYLKGSENTMNAQLYGNTAIVEVLHEKLGSVLTKLRLSTLTIGRPYLDEKVFLEGLTNLGSLHINKLKFSPHFGDGDIAFVVRNPFLNLKCLTIEKVQDNFYYGDVTQCIEELVTVCPKLEHLALPFLPMKLKSDARYNDQTCLNRLLTFFARKIYYDEVLNLKTIDFIHVLFSLSGTSWQDREIESFLQFCVSCKLKQVKLANIDGAWFAESPHPNRIVAWDLGATVVSIRCNNRDELQLAEKMNMPLLEELKVNSHLQFQIGRNPERRRPNWPKLLCLMIFVDEEDEPSQSFKDIKYLFQRFFENDPFPALQHVSVIFSMEKTNQKEFPWKQLVNSCFSLKKIMLRGWRGPKESLVNICKGVTGLELISLLDYEKGIEQVEKLTSESGHQILWNTSYVKEPKKPKSFGTRLNAIFSGIFRKPVEVVKPTNVVGPLVLVTARGLNNEN